jgi:hypothetical protein
MIKYMSLNIYITGGIILLERTNFLTNFPLKKNVFLPKVRCI